MKNGWRVDEKYGWKVFEKLMTGGWKVDEKYAKIKWKWKNIAWIQGVQMDEKEMKK